MAFCIFRGDHDLISMSIQIIIAGTLGADISFRSARVLV
ncbi:hypothetical protein UF75_5474 [Desulfosporosinus sp. I2]|nr:hypothetical protein UF75_5474 [Desulfosporosinus sp. I2]